jgi:demethylmenaquinone methyltransferase/2-methoxy-6-polyprenyl-1,4-benzoquinol methylase
MQARVPKIFRFTKVDAIEQEHSRENVHKMFDQISPTYDLTNRVMTLNLDKYWRRTMSSLLPNHDEMRVLDCATGTGDQLISLMENSTRIKEAVGIDLSGEMIAIGQKKLKQKAYAQSTSLQIASALELPFGDASFDCVTISFGIRNVTDVSKALREFYRVLKPGGRVLILEGTVPTNRALKWGHLFYMRHVMPRIGALISKNQDAYRYLNETIEQFPAGEQFCNLMREARFVDARAKRLSFGLVTIYVADKSLS